MVIKKAKKRNKYNSINLYPQQINTNNNNDDYAIISKSGTATNLQRPNKAKISRQRSRSMEDLFDINGSIDDYAIISKSGTATSLQRPKAKISRQRSRSMEDLFDGIDVENELKDGLKRRSNSHDGHEQEIINKTIIRIDKPNDDYSSNTDSVSIDEADIESDSRNTFDENEMIINEDINIGRSGTGRNNKGNINRKGGRKHGKFGGIKRGMINGGGKIRTSSIDGNGANNSKKKDDIINDNNDNSNNKEELMGYY